MIIQFEPVSKCSISNSTLICSRSRKAKNLTTGIHGVFQGLKFEPDEDIGQLSADYERERFEIGSIV